MLIQFPDRAGMGAVTRNIGGVRLRRDRPVTQPDPRMTPTPEVSPAPATEYRPTIPPERQRGGRDEAKNMGRRAPTRAEKLGRSFPGQGVPFQGGDFPGQGEARGVNKILEGKFGRSFNWSAEAANERAKAARAARKGTTAPAPRNSAEAVARVVAVAEDVAAAEEGGGSAAMAGYPIELYGDAGASGVGMAGFLSDLLKDSSTPTISDWLKKQAGSLIKRVGGSSSAPAPAVQPPAPGYTPAPYTPLREQPLVKWLLSPLGLTVSALGIGFLFRRRLRRLFA